MATIDLTLDSFKVPAIENYTPPFGTKIVKTDANKGGLSTVEVNSNIMMPFANMRPKVITENSSTTEIEYDAKLCFSASLLAGATLELDDGAYKGCRVQITNLSSFACDVEYNSATLVSIPTGANVEVLWTGSSWMLSTTGTVATGNVMAPTSSAVQAAIDDTISDYGSYSTIEQFTGKYWIDGKPIYRKVFVVGTFTDIVALMPQADIDELVDIRFKRRYDSRTNLFVYGDGIDSQNNLMVKYANDYLNVATASSSITIYEAIFILEYTKADPTP